LTKNKKGLVDKEELKKSLDVNFDENKFNKIDSDNDGLISYKGINDYKEILRNVFSTFAILFFFRI
jgi:Ca2+-binding EF-hand superfamily protein